MTKIKMCGLSRAVDIETANAIGPDYIGFIFWKKSKRYVSPELARDLKNQLSSAILAVGVFVNEEPEVVAGLLNEDIIDIAQLHGQEDEAYIEKLRSLTEKTIFQAFRVDTAEDVERAVKSSADYILLDNGAGGTGTAFDWSLIQSVERPFFLAGGLSVDNIGEALTNIKPYGVDVSSGIETNGLKDAMKMKRFAEIVRQND